MRPVSRAWKRTVAGSHTPVFEAILCETFQTGTSPTGRRLPILGEGSPTLTLDGLGDVRTTASLSVPGDLWPNRQDVGVAPYGNELYVRRGIRLRDDLIEWVGFGYLRIESPEQGEAHNNGPIALELVDRMQGIIDARMLSPVQFPASTTAGTFALTLVQEVYPLATVEWDDDSDLATLGRDVLVEEDRYAALKDVADSLGKIMYWNHRGNLRFESTPDALRPVDRIMAGRSGLMVTASRQLSRAGVYNAVVARGDGLDQEAPAYAVAYDSNPASPTYFHGRYGQVPRYYASPLLSSSAQALAAATAALRRTLGLPYQVSFGFSPDCSFEPFDPVWIEYGTQAPEIQTMIVLDIPLSPEGIMTAQCLEQTRLTLGSVMA